MGQPPALSPPATLLEARARRSAAGERARAGREAEARDTPLTPQGPAARPRFERAARLLFSDPSLRLGSPCRSPHRPTSLNPRRALFTLGPRPRGPRPGPGGTRALREPFKTGATDAHPSWLREKRPRAPAPRVDAEEPSGVGRRRASLPARATRATPRLGPDPRARRDRDASPRPPRLHERPP